ncbi:MAG: methionine--tRNA ligase [Cytophagia bacterium]|nr:MAG: methionine--tRNA ligase [Runella sp.]TAG20522.1 MAG: methionine--tRNA ligase [Cytophagales bacterium]TAG39704.1 MAG: methionine--tRNA ligase [Cytophagia bacterium]TAG52186.1 MAG: methionine--tRNA ligase [Runella slithyformis]TAG81306.1 MAG: methionine--tRNA ligase [Cytophagales bacterium]
MRYTITAALIYANGPIHIGHLAGCYVPSDIYARFLRASGHDVAFVSGTDEHGVPITIRAKKEGLTPQQVVDKYYVQIKKAFEDFGISFDIYSRTSSPIHHQTAQDFFTTLHQKGHFVEETTEQYYDQEAKQFLADRYIVGTCPVCGNPNAYGDQCERCGSTLSPTELKEPLRSMLSGAKPVLKATKNWYLPLDKMQPQIEAYVNAHPEWKTNVAGQCQSWLKDGLKPRAMTRDLEWGIKVPLPDTDGKVLYVWFDAPIGYISMTKEWAAQTGKNWEDYWKNKDTKLVHFIGKDNIVFHCIIFPAMLINEGSFILANNVPANEFMNLEGDKISTSRTWAVWLHEYLEELPNKQDVLRYVLTASAPETKDSEFTWKDFQTRNNSELVGIFGNFVNRAVVLTHKFCEGKVPPAADLQDIDRETLATLAEFPARIGESIAHYRFREALVNLMDLTRLGNKYLADTAPWHAIKENPERVNTIMNVSLQIVATLRIVCEPFMPFTSVKIGQQLGLTAETDAQTWQNAGKADLLPAGHAIGEGFLLFEKIEDATIEKQIQKLQDSKRMNELTTKQIAEQKPETQYDDFAKMDIRIGTITAAENVPKSKKLLKLTVNDGHGERTILSGIAEHFSPEEALNKQVCFLANLAPRKMMGMESQGMILMAEDRDGSLAFVQPSKPVWNGGTVN